MSYTQLVEALQGVQMVDLSPLFETNMGGWPAHPSMGIVSNGRNYEQNGYYAQTLILSEHTGSHVDAPSHIHAHLSDLTIDNLPVDSLIGPYIKIDVSRKDWQPGELLTMADLQEALGDTPIQPGHIVLFEFGWQKYFPVEGDGPQKRAWWGSNEPGIDEEVCAYLANLKIKAVGSDTAACDIAEVNGKVLSAHGHRTYFLPNRILIVEGLQNLSQIPKLGVFLALPLKIKNGSGSPIRPIAIF